VIRAEQFSTASGSGEAGAAKRPGARPCGTRSSGSRNATGHATKVSTDKP